jgi:hypothetical protein
MVVFKTDLSSKVLIFGVELYKNICFMLDPGEEELKLLYFLKYLDESIRLLDDQINDKEMQKSDKKSG